MTEKDKAIEAALLITDYCKSHENCKGCTFSFSQVCILKWTKPDGWKHSIEKLQERRLKRVNTSCYTDTRHIDTTGRKER